jgi:integrase
MRHTFISLLQNGASPAYVQKQAGHESMDIRINVYGHFIPGRNQSAVDRLDGTAKAERVASNKQSARIPGVGYSGAPRPR